ncbi:hypothetical protein E2C01_004463 [Portunus trituberculatus]|uniref:Uncharacterized protein n=1 Tax=Portunus trituberculatus TaxID=210409 RepID=A0A5B7CRV0_PORTR|nr:hypothetical protein [Portunus trituberculatus]
MSSTSNLPSPGRHTAHDPKRVNKTLSVPDDYVASPTTVKADRNTWPDNSRQINRSASASYDQSENRPLSPSMGVHHQTQRIRTTRLKKTLKNNALQSFLTGSAARLIKRSSAFLAKAHTFASASTTHARNTDTDMHAFM